MNRKWSFLFSILLPVGLVWWFLSDEKPKSQPQNTTSVSSALSGEQNLEGFQKAEKIRSFVFPKDHGPHPGFQTEWWYYTGNLNTEGGRHFGYQFTIFRRALRPDETKGKSQWRNRQIYFAHLALTDVKEERFFSRERYARSGMNLAGAQSNPYRVWLEDWVVYEKSGHTILEAADDRFSLRLKMKPLKKPVLQGNQGLSQKSAGMGNASYYYSIPRLKSEGKITIDQAEFNVNGFSWLDREWSTSALSKEQAGWDWFALQWENGEEFMYYQLRLKDGSVDPVSSGVLIDKNGRPIRLKAGDVLIKVLDYWKSPETGHRYPSKWRFKISKNQFDFLIIPYQNNQEHRHGFVYWEGAVKAESTGLKGVGYVELTGYNDVFD